MPKHLEQHETKKLSSKALSFLKNPLIKLHSLYTNHNRATNTKCQRETPILHGHIQSQNITEEATPKAAHIPLTPLFSDGLTIFKGSDGKEHYFYLDFISFM